MDSPKCAFCGCLAYIFLIPLNYGRVGGEAAPSLKNQMSNGVLLELKQANKLAYGVRRE